MKNKKKKGNDFERDISKKLSLWWSDGTNDDLFWRTQGSGSRWTVRRKKGKTTTGQSSDITSTSSDSQLFIDFFSIECKAYKDINIWGLIEGRGIIKEWWEKLCSECKEENKYPLLVLKQDYKPIIMLTNYFFYKINNRCNSIFSINDKNVYLYIFDDFLNSESEHFKKNLEKIKNV